MNLTEDVYTFIHLRDWIVFDTVSNFSMNDYGSFETFSRENLILFNALNRSLP